MTDFTYKKENLEDMAGEFFLEKGIYSTMLDFTIDSCLKSYDFAEDNVALSPSVRELRELISTEKEKEIARKVFAYAQAREELRSSLEVYLEVFGEELKEKGIEFELKK